MVLRCYDGSPTATHAITVAHAVLGSKPSTVLRVWPPPTEFIEPDWFGGASTLAGPPIAELEARAVERADGVAAEGTQRAFDLG